MRNQLDQHISFTNRRAYSLAPFEPSLRQAGNLSRKRILIVEDDPDHREILTTRLRSFGFLCQEAADGYGGLDKLGHSPFDLVISDYQMPQMNGIQFIQSIRMTKGLSTIPIILMTGHSDPTVIEQALSAGATTTLTKPCSFDTLKTALNLICSFADNPGLPKA